MHAIIIRNIKLHYLLIHYMASPAIMHSCTTNFIIYMKQHNIYCYLVSVLQLACSLCQVFAVLQRTLDEDCRQAEEPKQLADEASRFHLGRQCHTLRSSALVLCYSAAEYCAPVWSRSAHTSRVDVQLNSTMRLISGTLRSTPLPWLPVLSNIEVSK